MKRLKLIACTVLSLCIVQSHGSQGFAEELSGFDKAWSYLTLYENSENKVLQKFSIVGRAQLDAAWVDPDGTDSDGNDLENWNDTLWRRFRFGFEAALFENWKAHLEADFDLNEPVEDWYNKLTDAYIQWEPGDNVKIKALKQSAGFTLDGARRSRPGI